MHDFIHGKSNSQVADVAEEKAVAVISLVCSLEMLHYVADTESICEYPILEGDYVQRLAVFVARRLEGFSIGGPGKVGREHAACVLIQTCRGKADQE